MHWYYKSSDNLAHTFKGNCKGSLYFCLQHSLIDISLFSRISAVGWAIYDSYGKLKNTHYTHTHMTHICLLEGNYGTPLKYTILAAVLLWLTNSTIISAGQWWGPLHLWAVAKLMQVELTYKSSPKKQKTQECCQCQCYGHLCYVTGYYYSQIPDSLLTHYTFYLNQIYRL